MRSSTGTDINCMVRHGSRHPVMFYEDDGPLELPERRDQPRHVVGVLPDGGFIKHV